MSQNHTAIISGESITIFLDGEAYTVKRGDANFTAALLAVGEERWEDVPALVSRGFLLAKWAQGDFDFRDGLMYHKDFPLPHQLNERMIKMAKDGESPGHLLKFWALLQENPSKRSVAQLYTFLSHQSIPIDEDGYLLAYKSVRRNYRDHHSGKYDDSPGAKPEMPRNQVDDDPRSSCSDGFHLGALAYAKGFGGETTSRLMVCRVSPADVVSIPIDSSCQKMRVCKYEVLGHYGEALPSTIYNTSLDEAVAPKVEEAPAPEPRKDIESSVDAFANALGDLTPAPAKVEVKVVAQAEVSQIDQVIDLVAEPWLAFPNMSDEEVSQQKATHLRKYASRLGIVNSSRMKKDAVLPRILDVRNG